MLDKKITKEISNLLTSSDKARKAISAEIDKIDAKYRALAEKEKSKLTKMLKSIEEQMESYKTLLGIGDEVEPEAETVEPEIVDEEEEKVVDNLFPENNIEKALDEFVVENEPEIVEEAVVEEKVVIADNTGETADEWPVADEPVGEPVEDSEEDKSDEDEWPAFPEEWK